MNGHETPREVVRRGYDRIGEEYVKWRRFDVATEKFLNHALEALPRNGLALDLGCGPGLPVTAAIASGRSTVGVDLSAAQLSICRRNVPSAGLVQADITEVKLRPRSFNMVTAFYCLNHVPRERLGILLRRIESWLKPSGTFVGSFGAGNDPGSVETDWLGAPMFFSSFGVERSLSLLRGAGLPIVHHEIATQEEHGEPVSFLWVVCTRSDSSVTLIEHRSEWSEIFDKHRRTLAGIYDDAVSIEHVGSTAIRDIAAKPIVDIEVSLKVLTQEAVRVSQMEEAGYTYFGENGLPGRELFVARWPETVHIHVIVHGSEQCNRHIFRDYLIAHPDRARAYEALKLELARRHKHDRVAYTDGKNDFIEAVLAEAARLSKHRADSEPGS
jgi:GrpB-like predicted nucleotidyltransferase (UPF0157 family)